MSGDFSFERVTTLNGTSVTRVAVDNATLALGVGDTDYISLQNGQGLLIVDNDGVAGDVAGNVSVNLPGAAEVSGDFGLRFNNTNRAISESFEVAGHVVPLELPVGPYIRFEAANAQLNVAGQTVSGNILFEELANAVVLGITDGALSLGNGLVTAAGIDGLLIATSDGTAGHLDGSLAVNIPGVSVSGNFVIGINDSDQPYNPAQHTFNVGGVPVALNLPAGPYLRLVATDAEIEILGQGVSGNLSIEEFDTPGGPVTRIAIADGQLHFGGTSPVVSATGMTGFLVADSNGLAGQLEATASVLIPGVAIAGTTTLSINNTGELVVAGPFSDGSPVVTVPAGPYLRLDVLNGSLGVAGQTIQGDFALENTTLSDGSAVVRIAADNVTASLGDDVVTLADGSGYFLLSPVGAAGRVSGNIGLGLGGVTFDGTFSLEINNTSSPVNDTIQLGASSQSLVLPGGTFHPYQRQECAPLD